MDADQNTREQEKQQLLTRLAELMVEDQREEGLFLGTPHYSVIERAAMHLGRQLSRQAQERGAREIAANCAMQVACPGCGSACRVGTKKRKVTSTDGPVELTEAVAFCRPCRRSFFPSAGRPGNG